MCSLLAALKDFQNCHGLPPTWPTHGWDLKQMLGFYILATAQLVNHGPAGPHGHRCPSRGAHKGAGTSMDLGQLQIQKPKRKIKQYKKEILI
jgi:hypothetical protein